MPRGGAPGRGRLQRDQDEPRHVRHGRIMYRLPLLDSAWQRDPVGSILRHGRLPRVSHGVGQRGVRSVSPGPGCRCSRQVLCVCSDSRSRVGGHARDGGHAPPAPCATRQPTAADCHGAGVPHEPSFVDVHSSYAARGDARCASCHNDAFCTACHGTRDAAPARIHSAARDDCRSSSLTCATRCHEESDCTTCHEKHVHPGGAVDTAASGGGGQ